MKALLQYLSLVDTFQSYTSHLYIEHLASGAHDEEERENFLNRTIFVLASRRLWWLDGVDEMVERNGCSASPRSRGQMRGGRMYNFLSIINLVLAIATVIGGIMAYRHGFTRTANEVQERVIGALNSELAALTSRIESMEKENIRLHQIISTICTALKQRGIAVTIEGDMVNISDQSGTHTERIHEHVDGHGVS
jgi:uncharacterized protein (UPF0335 family)